MHFPPSPPPTLPFTGGGIGHLANLHPTASKTNKNLIEHVLKRSGSVRYDVRNTKCSLERWHEARVHSRAGPWESFKIYSFIGKGGLQHSAGKKSSAQVSRKIEHMHSEFAHSSTAVWISQLLSLPAFRLHLSVQA